MMTVMVIGYPARVGVVIAIIIVVVTARSN